MALMLTRRCNMRCGHCSVESGPDVRGEPTEAELFDRVRQAAASGVRAINLTGGEPMLRPWTALRLVRAARRLGVAPSRCAIVEDSPLGVDAANAAGMVAFGFARVTPPAVLSHARGGIFSSMAELPALLED